MQVMLQALATSARREITPGMIPVRRQPYCTRNIFTTLHPDLMQKPACQSHLHCLLLLDTATAARHQLSRRSAAFGHLHDPHGLLTAWSQLFGGVCKLEDLVHICVLLAGRRHALSVRVPGNASAGSRAMAAKALINEPSQVVTEALEGLVAATPHLALLEGFPSVSSGAGSEQIAAL